MGRIAKKTLKKTAIILLPLTASAACLTIIVLVLLQLTFLEKTPAHYLPADTTLALLHNPDDESIARYSAIVPALAEMAAAHPIAVAVVVHTDGTQDAVAFFAPGHVPSGLATIQAGPFIVGSRIPALLQGIAPMHGRVWDDPRYRAFKRAIDLGTPWLFLDRRMLQTSQDTEGFLTMLLLQDSSHIAIAQTDAILNLFTYHEPVRRNPLRISVLPQENERLASFALSNARALWTSALENSTPDVRTMMEGRIEQKRRDLFADAVSTPYDLLPLLEGNIAVTVGRSASGEILFAVQGTHDDERRVHTTLNRLHEGVRLSLPSIVIDGATFDKQFRWRTVHSDDTLIHEQSTNDGKWLLRETAAVGSTRGLFTALSPSAFIIASTEREREAHRNSMNQTSTIPSLNERGSGWVDTASLVPLLSNALPSLVQQDAWLTQFLPDHFSWSLEQKGPLATWTLQTENMSPSAMTR